MEYREKEVYFGQYCRKCKHWEEEEWRDTCHECLNNPINMYSHKPVNFEEKDKGDRSK